jgi:hypothetical protein
MIGNPKEHTCLGELVLRSKTRINHNSLAPPGLGTDSSSWKSLVKQRLEPRFVRAIWINFGLVEDTGGRGGGLGLVGRFAVRRGILVFQ